MLGLGEGEREPSRQDVVLPFLCWDTLSSAIVVGHPAKMLYCLFSSEASYSSQRQQHLGGMFAASTAEDMLQTFLAKAGTSRRDVCSKYCGGYATDFPREGRNCNPSLAACVSPKSPGASVKGELLPTLAARTCFNFAFVSPYLLCKPNLDDTCRLSHCCNPSLATCVSPISPGASVKGELLPTLAARTCFTFEFVWPYLLCKPNLDDTYEISARTIHKKVI